MVLNSAKAADSAQMVLNSAKAADSAQMVLNSAKASVVVVNRIFSFRISKCILKRCLK